MQPCCRPGADRVSPGLRARSEIIRHTEAVLGLLTQQQMVITKVRSFMWRFFVRPCKSVTSNWRLPVVPVMCQLCEFLAECPANLHSINCVRSRSARLSRSAGEGNPRGIFIRTLSRGADPAKHPIDAHGGSSVSG